MSPTSQVRAAAALAGLALALCLGGCARRVVVRPVAPVPPPKTVVVLEAEHADRNIVIVHRRPRPERHCWKHGDHWHCRVH